MTLLILCERNVKGVKQMKLKVNLSKLKNRMKEQKEKALNSRSDPKDSIMVKALGAGDLEFRAVPYPHNEDPTCEPFAERHYHYIQGLGYIYCPKKNDGEDCHLCDFVWERAKATKGTDAAKGWLKNLPTMHVLIPGKIITREDEGAKFFKITTRQDKPSDKYNKIYGWFENEDTEEWMNPDKGELGGFNMVLKYDEPDKEQASFLNLRKGQVILKDVELARKSTPFGKKGEYEAFLDTIPNIDETEPFTKKTTEDTLQLLEKWHSILKRKAPKKTEVELNKDEGTTVSSDEEAPATDSGDELSDKLASLGL